jgi:hypothetical protein
MRYQKMSVYEITGDFEENIFLEVVEAETDFECLKKIGEKYPDREDIFVE